MTIFRVEHNKNYTTINNYAANDKRLSFKAKGIWMYAFSRPDDWQFNLKDLMNHATDGRDKIYSGLRELADCGYLQKERERTTGGQFEKVDWVFYETPQDFKKLLPQTENPYTGNQDVDFPLNFELPSNNYLLSTDNTKQETPSAVVLKKDDLLEKRSFLSPMKFTSDQEMSFIRNHTSEELQKAVEYYLLQKDEVKDRFKWLKSCIKGAWWSNQDPEVQSEDKMRKSFLEAIKCLSEHFPNNVAIFRDGNDIKVGFRNDKGPRIVEFDITSLSLKRALFLAEEINNHLCFNMQIVYNELSGKKIFECLR